MLDKTKIRALLEAKKAELEKRLNSIKKDIHHREEPLNPDFAEQVVEQENMDVMYTIDNEGRIELAQVNKALLKLDSGEYGICASCGHDIDQNRLEAIPYALTCIDCAQ
jgi:RNA polymerase-binding protein DksA